jgi:hypothetical protein
LAAGFFIGGKGVFGMAKQGNTGKPGAGEERGGAMSEERKRQAFRNAANNVPIDREFIENCEQADIGLAFPGKWEDPLELLGCIELLSLEEHHKAIVRRWTLRLIDRKGPRYVWENRLFLKNELKYILETFL